MTNGTFQSGCLISKSHYLWIVPIVYISGKLMGYKIDNYEQYAYNFKKNVKNNKKRKDTIKQTNNG